MRLPMVLLAAACAAIGLFPSLALRGVAPVVAELVPAAAASELARAGGWLEKVAWGAGGFLLLALLLAALRLALLRARPVGETVTWDCGYAKPSATMQYTSSSFAQPLTSLFGLVLRTRRKLEPPRGLFPRAASMSSETPDAARESLFAPAFRGIGWALGRLRWLQTGRVHL